MIFGRLMHRVRDAICPSCGEYERREEAAEARLTRAEGLHIMSARTAAIENKKTERNVGYMRTVANHAVDRLRHERITVDGENE